MTNFEGSTDPMTKKLLEDYHEVWRAVGPDLRDVLRRGPRSIPDDAVWLIWGLPARFAVLALTVLDGGPEHWGIQHTFVNWAQTEAPSEKELAGSN